MIVDSSVWIEFFRATGSPSHLRLAAMVQCRQRIVVPDVVRAELLVGSTAEATAARTGSVLDQFEAAEVAPLIDAEEAARIHRACRRGGETIRNIVDCFVAATAARLLLPVLHRDRDFEVMARHVGLRTESML